MTKSEALQNFEKLAAFAISYMREGNASRARETLALAEKFIRIYEAHRSQEVSS